MAAAKVLAKGAVAKVMVMVQESTVEGEAAVETEAV